MTTPRPGRGFVYTLVIAVAGGVSFRYANLPVPWLIGSLIPVSLASLAGLPLAAPRRMRPFITMGAGMLIGSTVTPALLDRALSWIPSLLFSLVCLILCFGFSALYCARIARFSAANAVLCGAPGGLSEMVLLATDNHADPRTVALCQVTRLATVLSLVSLSLPLFSDAPLLRPGFSREPWTLVDAAITLSACLAVGLLLTRLKVPASWLLGALIATIVANLSGATASSPPSEISIGVQLLLGAMLGTRFAGFPLKEMWTTLLHSLAMTVGMLIITLLFASLVSLLTEFDFLVLLLAFAPGGLSELTLAAVALNIDPIFVTTHHLIRLLVLLLLVPFAIRHLT